MCGIIVSSIQIPINAYKFVENRGPDNTNIIEYNNINFIHFLLHLTGEYTLQPLIDKIDDIAVIFNGEIYNYLSLDSTAKSDIYSILTSYKKYGDKFIQKLDGEFTIILFDFRRSKLIISGDIFKTKPLFYNINNDIIISSYESSCKKIKDQIYNSIKPNEVIIFDLNRRVIINKYTIYEFDLKQTKTNYYDFINALETSILKRYPENSIPLVTLSSGLDSGTIACCLNKYKKKALYVSIAKNEHLQTINFRQTILNDQHKIIDLSEKDKIYWRSNLFENCEEFNWNWLYHYKINAIHKGFNQGSMLGKCKIINYAKETDNNIRVLLSGIGADEIMARNQNYSCGYGNVDYFPDDLNNVYPWVNFYYGTMENYLKGDEYIGGCHGFETRYPFCDKFLVQEFLWLHPNLKNEYKGSIYKPPLLYYLDSNKFPFYTQK